MTGPSAELVDVVDEDDVVQRIVTRAQMRREHLRHRCVFVAVRASDGGVLVHRRSADKDLLPSYWDLAAGGVVASGERYDDAAARELDEELGVRDVGLRPLGPVRFDSDDIHLIGRAYETVCDGPFVFADGEVSEVRWMTLAELAAATIAQREWMPDSVAVVLPLLT